MTALERRSVVAALGIVAVVLTGLWWLWGAHGVPGPTGASAGAPTAVAEGHRAGAARSGRDLDPAPPVSIDDDPAGSLRLEGQVVDADEHPVAGATVVIASHPPRSQVTEADGAFSFDRLLGRPYTLSARASHGVAGPVTVRPTATSDPVVLKLGRGGSLRVAVVGRDDKPIDGAMVELRGVDAQRAAANGRPAVFSPVVPGSYQVAAWAEGMAPAFRQVQIGAGDLQLRVTLTSGAPVTGRAVDDRGDGLAGVRIRYLGASDWSQQADDRYDAVMTDARGEFRFEALPAGSFRFAGTHPERAPGTSPLVTLDGKTQRDGVVIRMTEGAVIRGHVVDARQRPVALARIRISAAGPPSPIALEAPREVYSDAQGTFELKGLPRKWLSAVALHELGASQIVTVDATRGDIAELTLTLDLTGTIAGVVVDLQGQPVEGAQITAGPAAGQGGGAAATEVYRLRVVPQARSDASGAFVLSGLAPGTYGLWAAPATRARDQARVGDSVTAKTGDRAVRIVVAPDGGVRGRLAFSDGSAPELFSVSVERNGQSFVASDGSFVLEGLAPTSHELEVRGPGFQTRTASIVVESSKIVEIGTLLVVKGRSIAGIVVADGKPVPGATVYAGRAVFGSGTAAAQGGRTLAASADATKTTTTDGDGGFQIAGFGDGDVTLIAEHEALGRSRALRLPAGMPGQTELTLVLETPGAVHGTLHQVGAASEGVLVTCQSTSTPGAIYRVPAGEDGGYRFDLLAPDTYKVSAMLREGRSGARFASRQVELAPGGDATADLDAELGAITLDVAFANPKGAVGAASVWLASGTLAATRLGELMLKLAAAGAGTSIRLAVARGEPKQFTGLTPGAYSVCVTPLPLAVTGAAIGPYLDQHGDSLQTFCEPVTVRPSPPSQDLQIVVELPSS